MKKLLVIAMLTSGCGVVETLRDTRCGGGDIAQACEMMVGAKEAAPVPAKNNDAELQQLLALIEQQNTMIEELQASADADSAVAQQTMEAIQAQIRALTAEVAKLKRKKRHDD